MTKQELIEMVTDSLHRLTPSVGVSDIPSAFPGKRVLAANLPRGLFFKESGSAVIHVHYVAGNEVRAAEKLLVIAQGGIGGELPGRQQRRLYEARRTFRFLTGRGPVERVFVT